MSSPAILTQLPAAPADYDAVASSGWLGASKLYAALLPTLSGEQAQRAAAVMDELRERNSAQFAAAYERQLRTIGHLQTT